MYLVDTNVLSETRRARPHGAVLAWLDSVPENTLFFSAVSVGEIQKGIEKAHDTDPEKARQIEGWLETLTGFGTVIPMGSAEFRRWAKFMHRRSNDFSEDAMIAATADVHGLTVATRNVKDFQQFDVPVVNPFEYGRSN